MIFVPLVEIDIGFLADQVRVTASNTLCDMLELYRGIRGIGGLADFGQGVHDLLLSFDIGIEKTKNELEVRLRKSQHLGSSINASCGISAFAILGISYLLSRYERPLHRVSSSICDH